MSTLVKKIFQFWRSVFSQFRADGCMGRAGELTYMTLLSLVPLLVMGFLVLRFFPIFSGISNELEKLIVDNFVAGTAVVVQEHLHRFLEQAPKLSIESLAFLLVTAILMIFNIEQAFNAIWKVPKHRKGIPAFLIYWAVLTLLPIFISIGLAIISYFISLPFVSGATKILGINKIWLLLAPSILTFLAFTFLYLTIPNCKVLWRSAMSGGIVALVLFEVAKRIFVLYISRFPAYQLLYGALAVIPLFLIWIYLVWIITLFGGVVSYQVNRVLLR